MTDLVERSVGPDDLRLRQPAAPREKPALPSARPAAARGPITILAGVTDGRRVFHLLPFAATLGIIIYAGLAEDPPLALYVAASVVVALLALASLRSYTALRVAGLGVALWAGFCLLPLHGVLFGTQMLARPVFGTVQATVDEVLASAPGEQRVIVSALTWSEAERGAGLRRARVVVKQGPTLAPGDLISASMRLAPVPGPAYPGGFDGQFQAYFDGIGAYGNTTKPPTLVTEGQSSPARTIDFVRHAIAARIDAELSQPSAGIARAIINGDQSAVTDAARDTMATAGIAHVLSVSGLHLTIVAGGVFWVVRLLLAGFGGLAQRLSVKRLAAVAGMASALFYYGISGGNVAALRSTLMILLVFGAVLFGRRALTMRNVAIAGLLVIATDPASVFRPSFQLSFAAVIGLVGAYESLARQRGEAKGLLQHGWGYFKGIVITSVVAGLSTLLFSVYHFQQTSPLGVVGNLFTLPLVGFVMMPAAVIGVLLMPFGLERPFILAMGWSIDRMLEMAQVVAEWSTHLRAAPLLSPVALLIGLAALAWFAFLKGRWRLAGPALAVPLVLLFGLDHPPDVLIADTTQAIAMRGADGLDLLDGKAKSFVLDVWRETYSDAIATPAAAGCDALACAGHSAVGFDYALVTLPEGFAEECDSADLIITRERAPGWCGARTVIDATALARGGVQWLRWLPDAKRFEIRTALGSTARPWRPSL